MTSTSGDNGCYNPDVAPPAVIANTPDGVVTGPSSVAERVRPTAITMTPEGFADTLRLYNPEDDAKVMPRKMSYAALTERAAIPRVDADKKPTRVSGWFSLPGRRRPAFVAGWDGIDRMRESAAWKAGRLREAYGLSPRECSRILREASTPDGAARMREQFMPDLFGLGAPGDVGTGGAPPNDEFHPIMLGPFSRQLYLYDMLDMQSKAFEAWNHNPILKSAINIVSHFTLGDGVRVRWSNPRMQELWDEWVLRVKWDEQTRLWFRDACILGEAFIHDAGSSIMRPSMELLDASTVWEIVTNPRRIEDVYYLHRQFPTQYQVPYAPEPGAGLGVSPSTMPDVSEYVIEQIPPEEFLHVKLNATIGEKRGRSDLFSVLGWGKRFRDWFNAAVVKGQISNAFVVWWEVDGSDADVQALKNNPDFKTLPPPGTIWFSNKAAVPHLMGVEGGGASMNDRVGEQLLSIIATSLNLPPEYLGVSGAAARATALKRGEPAGKIFESRQQVVREAVSWQARRFAAAMIANGSIPSTEPTRAAMSKLVRSVRGSDWDRAAAVLDAMINNAEFVDKTDTSFEVITAKVEPEDRSIILKDLATARVTGVISQERYSTQVAELLDMKDFEFDREQAAIADELERGIGVPTMPKTGAGGMNPGGDGNGPGTSGAPPVPGSTDDEAQYKAATRGRPKP